MTVEVFVDTSALFAVLARDDDAHLPAVAAWERLLDGIGDGRFEAVLHSGIVLETSALVQHRLGMAAARTLLTDVFPSCTTVWVDAALHEQAAAALLNAGRRGVRLVDWTSFTVMWQRGIEDALSFDRHFADQGFVLFR